MWVLEETVWGGVLDERSQRGLSVLGVGMWAEATWSVCHGRCFSARYDLQGVEGAKGALLLEEEASGNRGSTRAQSSVGLGLMTLAFHQVCTQAEESTLVPHPRSQSLQEYKGDFTDSSIKKARVESHLQRAKKEGRGG
ncbi:hypothetical protein NDU88_005080 [Pleurodeles waltl]|uniref:Uncharacterized protein n=1 Tax=Pleurodeles waltl TaxID=8319 RepID=A0AAV7M878_PLEWA|nr:hypothetical protein NDU88_005080 [Pleurodeles waltl]